MHRLAKKAFAAALAAALVILSPGLSCYQALAMSANSGKTPTPGPKPTPAPAARIPQGQAPLGGCCGHSATPAIPKAPGAIPASAVPAPGAKALDAKAIPNGAEDGALPRAAALGEAARLAPEASDPARAQAGARDEKAGADQRRVYDEGGKPRADGADAPLVDAAAANGSAPEKPFIFRSPRKGSPLMQYDPATGLSSPVAGEVPAGVARLMIGHDESRGRNYQLWTPSSKDIREVSLDSYPGLSEQLHGAASNDAAQQRFAAETARSANQAGVPKPVSPENNPELFEPESSRVGIGGLRFLYWNTLHKVLQWANLKFAKGYRRYSWDKWPTPIGLLYLIAKMRFLRANTVTDPYSNASKDVKPAGVEPERAKKGYMADGSWATDRERPRMGAENTRFGSNIPPKKVRPDAENMKPSAETVANELMTRKPGPDGKDIVKPAGILNDLAGWWIQFQFHNFGGNTKRHPVTENPHRIPRDPKQNWPGNEALIDRTVKDPSRVTDNGRPTIMNERTQAWVQAQIYGTNEEEQKRLRSFKDGKLLLDANGNLPEDPNKPGFDLTGFNNNYSPGLSFLHWAFVVSHNDAAEHLKKFNPTWDDETLFLHAQKMNVALTDVIIHTTEWTEDLLQHPTLQKGMHADAYGLLGPKLKAWLMRLSYRHPLIAKLIKPLSNNDVIWGMAGSKWEHHDGPFQVPLHFRMVYRLHSMVLSEHELLEPGTDRTLDVIEFKKFIAGNTREIVEKRGYDVLAYSFARKSAGHLLPHNGPSAMGRFENPQDKTLMNMFERDILRERQDWGGKYSDFVQSLGEPIPQSFLELTGGDAETAKELERIYGEVDKVDAGVGIIFAPKPAGFALSFPQFYQFVLNAPRRVKSNRHLTEGFTHKDYTFEGMEWVLHSNGMGGVIARAMKGLPYGKQVVAAMEGVERWFMPWPDTETFPRRLLARAEAESGAILKKTAKLSLFAAVTAFAAWMGIAISSFDPVYWVAALTAAPVLLYFKRMLAWRYMYQVWEEVYTDKRHGMFPTLFRAEKWTRFNVFVGGTAAKLTALSGLYFAWNFWEFNPVVAIFAAVTALMAFGLAKATKKYANTMALLKIALQNRMREGYEAQRHKPEEIPGDTAIVKRYWMLVPKNAKTPVARLFHTARVLRTHGLGPVEAFKTALISHLVFGPRTQRGLGIRGRWKAGILFSPFAIYVPNMVQAQGRSSTGIYAHLGNDKGVKPGDVDLQEFDRMFSLYAPGRDYMTAYDFSRMREDKRWRDSQAGVGGPVSRWIAEIAVKKRTDQLLQLYADAIANEDKTLVPAISREMMLRVYQGTAQADILAERALTGIHKSVYTPRPVPVLPGFWDSAYKLRKSLRLPFTWSRIKANFAALRVFFKEQGGKALFAFFAYYLIRDTTLYIVIPYLLYKGIIG